MGDKTKGLYNKFIVRRADGKDAPGEKHHGCAYFALGLTHDPHVWPALAAYAESCRSEYPLLAADLDNMIAFARLAARVKELERERDEAEAIKEADRE